MTIQIRKQREANLFIYAQCRCKNSILVDEIARTFQHYC